MVDFFTRACYDIAVKCKKGPWPLFCSRPGTDMLCSTRGEPRRMYMVGGPFMKRKLLSVLLTLCLAFSLLPTAALAATVENCPGDEFCTHQAAIGSTHYDTLQEAINAAQKGETVQMLADVNLGDEKLSIDNQKANVIFDLSGHVLTGSGQYTVSLKSNNWIIQNGKIVNTNTNTSYGALYVWSHNSTVLKNLTVESKTIGIFYAIASNKNGIVGSVTVEDGTKISGETYGVSMKGQPKPWRKTRDGKEILNVNGGEIIGKTAAIAVYGADEGNVKAEVIVNIKGGKVSSDTGYAIAGNGAKFLENTTINISGGEVVSATDTAIYHPQAGTLTVSGGTISGVTGGIQMCSGNLVVTGGTITATGNGDTSGKTGDGSIPDGAAVSVVDRGYPGGAPTATITGGNLTSATGVDAVTGYNWDKNTSSKTPWSEGENKDQLVVSGGTFSSDVTKFVPNGFEAKAESETFKVAMKGDMVVAILGDGDNQLAAYGTLQEAFAAAKNGQTLKLLDSISSDRINLENKSIVVDFNGKTLTSTAAYGVMFCAKNGNKITVNGTTEGSKLVGTLMVTSGTDGHIVVNGGTYENSKYCPIYINGAVNSENSTLTVKNATITASGTDSDQDTGCAVYLAGYCTSTFEDTTVTAPVTGIEIRAGKLTLTNCDVTGGNGEVETNANGNGTTVKNAALAISQHNTKKKIAVTVNGGTFTGTAAIYQTNVQDTGSADVKVNVKDGQFKGAVSAETNGTIAVSGGTFDKPVKEEYCANNYIPKDNGNGTYGVKRGSYIAQVNDGEKFETLQAAVDAASNGDTITLLKNCTESVTVSGKSLTIVKDGKVYDFAKVTVDSNSIKTENGDTLTITYTAPSSSSGSSGYYVSTPSKTENGTVTVSPRYADKGDTVTVTVKPDSGYVLETLTVTDKNGNELTLKDKGNGKYTFTMPAGKVEVKATFMEDNSMLNFFYDVPNNAYFYEAVKWAVENGITTGVGNDLFAPEQPCTRAQIVTFLWRAAGSPEPKGAASGMTDVVSGSYYEKAVAWAIENGITTGTTTSTFSPDATCTRAQIVTFLYRAYQGK